MRGWIPLSAEPVWHLCWARRIREATDQVWNAKIVTKWTKKAHVLNQLQNLQWFSGFAELTNALKKTLQTRIRALGGSLTTIKDMYVSHGHIHFCYFNPVNVKDRDKCKW